ncbi:MAG: hemophore-related protein, partial [Mycobacterium sp.]
GWRRSPRSTVGAGDEPEDADREDGGGAIVDHGAVPAADARTSVRGYFTAHPGEFFELNNIVQPLKDVKSQCGVDISPSQLATLFDALSS